MNYKYFISIVFVLIIASLSTYAQITPKKNNYYILLANTREIVKNEADSNSKPQSLPRGSKIFVLSMENGNVYFRITEINSDECKTDFSKNDLYFIPISDFTEKYFRFRAGFTGGLINAPFKYRPDKNKIYPGGNLAYYGSWLINIAGLEIKPLLFGGLTTIATSDINVNKDDTITKLGYTMGLGLGLDIFDSFDLGIISGWDFIDKDWESNGRVWFAVSFNFSL